VTPSIVASVPSACVAVMRTPKAAHAPISTKAGTEPWMIDTRSAATAVNKHKETDR